LLYVYLCVLCGSKKYTMELKVTLVQPDLIWEDKTANLEKISRMLEKLALTDLILLPEMFPTGFSMHVETLAEKMEGPTIGWMKEKAYEKQAVVAGSLIIAENGSYFNRLVWAQPDGNLQWYDKRHLFSMGEEHLHFTPGNQRMTVEWKRWKIRLLICYDLRFPVWSRNHDDYDLLIYTANWPSARHHVWKNLLTARALENQSFCIGVNRVGIDGMGLEYSGDSGCIDARGEAGWMGNIETTRTFTLSLSSLHTFRQKFPILKDRDAFTLPFA
jgi:omega-amidase